MKYEVVQKILGTNTFKVLNILDLPSIVQDMCFVPETGIVFVYDNCLGKISIDGKVEVPWIGEIGSCETIDSIFEEAKFNNPSSICYNKHHHSIYAVENYGRSLRKIELQTKEVTSPYGESMFSRAINSFFPKKLKLSRNYICADPNGNVYWTVPFIHRCFSFMNAEPRVLIGNGVAGYSVVSKKELSQIHTPTGITADLKSVIFVDAGNKCIREIREESIALVDGVPPLNKKITQTLQENTNLLYNPSKLMFDQNVLYILDNNVIKSRNRSTGTKVASIDGTQGTETMCLDEKRNLIWMRRLYERKRDSESVTGSN
ncbi:MAG: hypothetical protein WC375_07270 [Methanomassiliicoccales archaeon]|jgi:hypothetical protein